MYVRFISSVRSRVRGVNEGIFSCAYECRDCDLTPNYLRREIRSEINWFKENLPVPSCQAFRDNCRRRVVVCWFKSEAEEVISHALALRMWLNECGHNIKIVGTKQPGIVCYSDAFQVVARPIAATPTSWG